MKLQGTEKRDDHAKYVLRGFDFRTIDVVRTKLQEGVPLTPGEMKRLAFMLNGVIARCKETPIK